MAIGRFKRKIWDYYRTHRRELPWRPPALKLRADGTLDPYSILVSEVMLQQTQVVRVREYYPRFLKRFPTARALARAPLRAVLRAWQGLGYNRRALLLHHAVQKTVSRFPDTLEELKKLPGVGPATAAAVMAFAFNKPSIYLDTNVRAVYLHHFFMRRRKVHDGEIIPFIEKTLDRKNPRAWYYALLDYGAWLKTQIENPSRRSAHYVKQSRFDGSNRQLRGAIIRMLTQQGKMTTKEIGQILRVPASKIREIIRTLTQDGLVHATGTGVKMVQ